MGAIGGLLGLNGGSGGTGFTPVNPTNQGQIGQGYAQAQYGLNQQSNLLNALQGQNGLGNQSSVYNQLQGVANGTGPNPAQAQLAQATGQNVAQQASLAAGQRGAASNVGLMARQAAQTGSNAQQQAAGQAATLQANQSLNALGQMGGIANTQAANQIGATGALSSASQGEQGQLLNAQNAYNAGQTQLAGQGMQNQTGLIGGVLNGIGGALGLADGGQVGANVPSGPQSSLGQFLQGMGSNMSQSSQSPLQQGISNFTQGLGNQIGKAFQPSQAVSMPMGQAFQAAEGGKVPVKLSPQEKVLSPQKAQEFARGGNLKGSTVPGQPKKPGKNDYANDTYSTSLKPGSIVIPLESLHSNEDARKFVQATLAKKGKR